MTVSQLAKQLNLKTLTVGSEKEVSSCYISDLLSRVMGSCKEGDVWITVQTSINMVAVALMIDAACVVFPEGLTAPDNTIQKATSEGLALFTSDKTAYELAIEISKLLNQ